MPYRAVLAALALVALALVAGAAPAAAQIFVFHLSGDQEAPPVPSLATGGCYGDLDQIAGDVRAVLQP